MPRNMLLASSRRVLTGALLAAVTAGCTGTRPTTPRVVPTAPAVRAPGDIRVRVGHRVVSVAFEDYVAGTAISEVLPVDEAPAVVDRVYDVQTIVARTYALAHLGRHRSEGFDLCDTTHCQVYEPARLGTSRFAGDVRRAVSRTSGQVLLYAGRPIDALFSADCGGHSATPEQVWGSVAFPYLRAAPDEFPSLTHRSWRVQISRDHMRTALNADPRTEIGRALTSLKVQGPDTSGRVSGVEIIGDRRVVVRSDEFRQIVNRVLGPRGIQSTRFTMRVDAGAYVLEGTGFGHGVGLCQIGAIARARRQTPAEEILSTYFPGARVAKLGGRIP
ncbi:MAG: SpoIID/LytB domain-containing protein [Acidobacteria bacterium]|nr:SpoIID/LytB domain-containing protein [Acidobacteriota bacterium]